MSRLLIACLLLGGCASMRVTAHFDHHEVSIIEIPKPTPDPKLTPVPE